jgi:hypothetical protein
MINQLNSAYKSSFFCTFIIIGYAAFLACAVREATGHASTINSIIGVGGFVAFGGGSVLLMVVLCIIWQKKMSELSRGLREYAKQLQNEK